jgi:hypothetical protein
MKSTLDLEFITFYIDKKYKQSVSNYYNVSGSVASKWKSEGIPEQRIHEFVYNEGSKSPIELFKQIYTDYEILSFKDENGTDWDYINNDKWSGRNFVSSKGFKYRYLKELSNDYEITKVRNLSTNSIITDPNIIAECDF